MTLSITGWLEVWTAAKDDKQIAWTLGIGWACCGGGLAGGTLVFAKATVKLLSGALSNENKGNQFGHVAPIFTIILLAATAVLQIICLNRGLRVYDSTLVVPVFYGVYTATG
jgi:magnesium transporter